MLYVLITIITIITSFVFTASVGLFCLSDGVLCVNDGRQILNRRGSVASNNRDFVCGCGYGRCFQKSTCM